MGSKIYMKGNTAFWKAIGGGAAAQLLTDRWVRVPPSQKGFEEIGRFTDLDQLAQAIGSHGKLVKKGTKDFRGHKVILLQDLGASGGTLYVAASGKPYPRAIVSPNNGAQGLLSFDDWNKVVAIAAPKSAIDLSKVKTGS